MHSLSCYSVPVDFSTSSWMRSQKANGYDLANSVGHAAPAGCGYSVGRVVMWWTRLPVLRTGRVMLRLTPVGGLVAGAIKSQRATMRPEVMNAALRLIKMLQLFHRYCHAWECNFWKRFYCIFVMFPLIASYRLELRKGKGSNGLSYGAIAYHIVYWPKKRIQDCSICGKCKVPLHIKASN